MTITKVIIYNILNQILQIYLFIHNAFKFIMQNIGVHTIS